MCKEDQEIALLHCSVVVEIVSLLEEWRELFLLLCYSLIEIHYSSLGIELGEN